MNMIHTTKPTKEQKKDMESLVASCREKEPMSLTAPLEEDLEYDLFLLYEKDHLTAMAFLFFPDDTRCECCAFVEPAERRKGYFAKLLSKVLDLVEAYEKKLGQSVDFCFLADERTPSAQAVLEAMEAEYWYSEHTMARSLNPKDQAYVMDSLTIEPEGDNLYSACLKGRVIGTCAVIPSGRQFYLYSFQIHEDYQGQGFGTQFLLGMLSLLSRTGHRVTLQVSGQNYIARNLYKKTGFQTTESLSYYLY